MFLPVKSVMGEISSNSSLRPVFLNQSNESICICMRLGMGMTEGMRPKLRRPTLSSCSSSVCGALGAMDCVRIAVAINLAPYFIALITTHHIFGDTQIRRKNPMFQRRVELLLNRDAILASVRVQYKGFLPWTGHCIKYPEPCQELLDRKSVV